VTQSSRENIARPRLPPYSAWLIAAIVLTLSTPRCGLADEVSTSSLKMLSVEDLMNVEVTSVTRHPQKLLDSASAIQVITQEDIRRSGATSIPEALRLADNLQVAQKNSHDWAISARGFNTALANKLLVMIDGRTVYTPLYSGVFWDVQDYPLEDIDRIEVISGPGGTLWGANAVNGVINIITKSAADTQGLYAEAGGGSQPENLEAARFGGSLGQNANYRVYGKFFDRGDEILTDGASAADAWHQGRTGFRMDSGGPAPDKFTVQGDYYDGHEETALGRDTNTSGDNVLGRWTRVFSDVSDLSLQAYLDQTHIEVPEGPLTIAGTPFSPPGTLYDDLTTYDVDFQHRFQVGPSNHVVWGLGYRLTHDVDLNAPALGFLPAVLDQRLYSGFLQDELALRSNLSLTVGSKLEHNDYTGFEYEPNARLSWILDSTQALWGAISRAVRTPSRIDEDLSEGVPPYLVLLKGSTDFTSESVVAYELGYRAQLNSQFNASISTFYNHYNDVRSTSFTPLTVLPLYFSNNLEGDTDGVEFSGNYRISDDWSLHAGYTFLNEHLRVKPGGFDLDNALNETADPRHQLSLRSSLNLPMHTAFDADLRWVDELHTNNGPTPGTVPAYFELNTRLAWQASKRLELSVVGQNLLHNHHAEYGFPGPTGVEIERSVYGKVAWRY
jgi:iron complex outermembrane recepter protein